MENYYFIIEMYRCHVALNPNLHGDYAYKILTECMFQVRSIYLELNWFKIEFWNALRNVQLKFFGEHHSHE